MNPYIRAAACLMLLVALLSLFMPLPQSTATADTTIVMVPEGGRLEAIDADGRRLGPVPLQKTAVSIEVGGPFAHVALRQSYSNPYDVPIEAIYTFPLSHRAAVNRMTLSVGDRVVEGEVRERIAARRIYESARDGGYASSLLEQERANIFTQSVANIDPGATIEIEIAYVEMVSSRDGQYELSFPMTVAPRYVPSAPTGPAPTWLGDAPHRRAATLLGPARIEVIDDEESDETATNAIASRALEQRLSQAIASDPVDDEHGERTRFRALYADGTVEVGFVDAAGRGEVGGRWFRCPPAVDDLLQEVDEPMSVRPPTRAGHDVSIDVSVDTGGPPILELTSELHRVDRVDEGRSRARLSLARQSEIPNRDFVLRWRTDGASIQEGVFTHASEAGNGFVTLVIAPPARVEASDIAPREITFVLDSSGSMSGFPIEKSKALVERTLRTMRADDAFNVIAFADSMRMLWPEPRSASAEKIAEAHSMLEALQSGGEAELTAALDAALAPTRAGRMRAEDLANLPADGRRVEFVVPMTAVHQKDDELRLHTTTGGEIPLRLGVQLPTVLQPEGVDIRLAGRWNTEAGRRMLAVDSAGFAEPMASAPVRLVVFLTSGLVADEAAIVDAVRRHARTTRVFTLGIGERVNRSLIERMALAGRGESEVVLSADHADAAIERLARRLETPVLTDIEVAFDGVEVTDLVSGVPAASPDLLPDLFGERPLLLHGRYAQWGSGTVTVRGRTGAGVWESTRSIDLPEVARAHAALPTLWARAKVDQLLAPHLAAPEDVRASVVALGEAHRLVTPFTSFVAVERSRIRLGGRPMTVAVPTEMTEGVQWEGVFERGRIVGVREALLPRLAKQRNDQRRNQPVPDSRRGGAAAPSSEPEGMVDAARDGSHDGAVMPPGGGRSVESNRDRMESPDRPAGAAPGGTEIQPLRGRRRVTSPPNAALGGFDASGDQILDIDLGVLMSGEFMLVDGPRADSPRDSPAAASGIEMLEAKVTRQNHRLHERPDSSTIMSLVERASDGPFDSDMSASTVMIHEIADIATAMMAASAMHADPIDRVAAERRIAEVVRLALLGAPRLSGIDPDSPPAVIAVAHDDRLIVVGDERTQMLAEAVLEESRFAFGLMVPNRRTRTPALTERLRRESGDAAMVADRLRVLSYRLEPLLFATVVDGIDPDEAIVAREPLQRLIGDLLVPRANERLVVSVLISEASVLRDGASMAALREAGLRIDATIPRVPSVVGEIDVESLASLAEVPGVLRIVRAKARPDEASSAPTSRD